MERGPRLASHLVRVVQERGGIDSEPLSKHRFKPVNMAGLLAYSCDACPMPAAAASLGDIHADSAKLYRKHRYRGSQGRIKVFGAERCGGQAA